MRFLTSGESHGRQLTAIIEGLPANFLLDIEKINNELARRQKGYGRGGRMLIEKDKVEILSGMRFGKTIASPLTLVIENKDYQNWGKLMDPINYPNGYEPLTIPRPGHADLVGAMKYQFDDIRNVLERSSARETAIRVAVGAISRQYLEALDIKIASHVVRIGDISINNYNASIDEIKEKSENSETRCIDEEITEQMITVIKECQQTGDSVGGICEIIVENFPVGIGSYVDSSKKIDGKLAQSVMSIQAIKGIELGLGFKISSLTGKVVHDEICYDDQFYRSTNNYGGIEGGMTTGMPIVIRAAIKPIPTLMSPLMTVDIKTKSPIRSHKERSDVCAVPATAVVVENIVAITLLQSLLDEFEASTFTALLKNVEAYRQRCKRF